MLGVPGSVRVPAPDPMPIMRPVVLRPLQSSALTRWRRMAAPVGVTRSPAIPSSRQG